MAGDNPCLDCKRKCCVDFMIGLEIRDPIGLSRELSRWSFIHKTGSVLKRIGGNERVLGVYNCDRFNRDTGLCEGYETEKRPYFCSESGIVFRPQKECKLFMVSRL